MTRKGACWLPHLLARPLPLRRHPWAATVSEQETDGSPPWCPVITGPGCRQPREARHKGSCETRTRTRSQKQQGLVNPKSPSVRNFPKHLCPAPKQDRPDTYLRRQKQESSHHSRNTSHSRSWVFKTWVPCGLICGITSRHRPNNCFENMLGTRQTTSLLTGVASGESRQVGRICRDGEVTG